MNIYRELDRINDEESLQEDVLLEATRPMYREMLFNVLEVVSTSTEFKEFISSSNRDAIQFHHIDGEYEGTLIKTAKHNTPDNIAIVTTELHKELTKMNKGKTSEEKIANFQKMLYANPGKVFAIQNILPNSIQEAVASEVREFTLV